VSLGESPSPSAVRLRRFRDATAVVGFIVWFLSLVPPLGVWARRYEFVQAVQFCSFATLTPALLVTGAPWRWLGLASLRPHRVGEDGPVTMLASGRMFDRLAITRQSQRGYQRGVTWAGAFIALVLVWRYAPVVDALVNHPWLTVLESLSFVGVGVPLWLELVESPPLTPSTPRPVRIALAAVSMWTIWIIAYLNGLLHSGWYDVFHHSAGHGVSLAADQQLTSYVMWVLSAAPFIPIVFWNLIHWLQSEEDPDDEMHKLIRDEKIRGPFGINS